MEWEVSPSVCFGICSPNVTQTCVCSAGGRNCCCSFCCSRFSSSFCSFLLQLRCCSSFSLSCSCWCCSFSYSSLLLMLLLLLFDCLLRHLFLLLLCLAKGLHSPTQGVFARTTCVSNTQRGTRCHTSCKEQRLSTLAWPPGNVNKKGRDVDVEEEDDTNAFA